MKGQKKRRYLVVNTILILFALIVTIVGNSIALKWDGALTAYFGEVGGGVSGEQSEGTDNQYFKSNYNSQEELEEAQKALAEQIVGEGTVLLKNSNDTLPLAEGAKVSLFGIASASASAAGSGSGASNRAASTLYQALEVTGFKVNSELNEFYVNSGYKHGTGTGAGAGDTTGDYSVNEVPQSAYTDEVKKTYGEYSDAAIVVFSRTGGEGGDLPTEMSRFGGSADSHYLELSAEEKELLVAIQDSGVFEKVIVLINAANAMELGFVDEEKYGVDACLWYSGTGEDGCKAVAEILKGTVNPSGRLVDTYVYDNFSAPSMQNFGDFRYVDADGNLTGYSYINYGEGIYVGYRYYETRYEDVVLGTENAGNYDYNATVKYPFGYGLSYTDFAWSDMAVEETDGTYQVSVTVTNTGNTAGKDVVQVYVQAPYTLGGVEKASVVLTGYGKTDIIEPGQSETVQITFTKDDFASYDENGEKTYILDAGTYYVSAGKNAHSALNNILSYKGYSVSDGMTEDGDKTLVYSFEKEALEKLNTSSIGTEVTNQFDDVQLQDATYLSRSNWKAMDNDGLTYATGSISGVSNVTDAEGTAQTVVISQETLALLQGTGAESVDLSTLTSQDFPSKEDYTYGAENNVVLADLIGKSYDDPLWDTLLDEMKLSEMHTLFNSAGYGMAAIESIGMPKLYNYDGPAGISNYITGASSYSFPSSIMLSAAFNKELAEEFGSLIGEDGINTQTSGWYAPAVNIHRTPFAGRNYEYYSEDPLLSGETAAGVIRSVQDMGVYVFLKHYALNDQETNRAANGSVATWSSEQAIRQIYLKPFQIAEEKGDVSGIMLAFNRLGTTQSIQSHALLTKVTREEWGFDGIFITDACNNLDQNEVDHYLAAGGNLILTTTSLPLTDAKTNWCRAYLRESAHRVLYTVANSLAMNGLSSGMGYRAGTPIYRIFMYALDALIAIGLLIASYFTFRTLKMTEEEFRERRAKTKKQRMICWGCAIVVAVIILSALWAKFGPILESAFLIY